MLAIEVEGDEAVDEDDVRSVVNGIEGVRAALKVSNVVPLAAPELSEDEKRFQSVESEAGDTEIRDRILFFSQLSRYPNISNRLLEIKGSIPAEDQPNRFYQLGRGFGQNLVSNLEVREEAFDLQTALEKVVMPGIQPLATATVLGEAISVESYARNLDRGAPSELHSRFFHGTLEGLPKGVKDLPMFRVERQCCLRNGASSCAYHIVPA